MDNDDNVIDNDIEQQPVDVETQLAELKELVRNSLNTQAHLESELEALRGRKDNPAQEKEILEVFVPNDEAMDNAIQNATKFNELLNNVSRKTKSNILQEIVGIVGKVAAEQVSIQLQAKTFYDTYPELASHKNVVARVTKEIETNNPRMSVDDVLKQAAITAMKELKIERVRSTPVNVATKSVTRAVSDDPRSEVKRALGIR